MKMIINTNEQKLFIDIKEIVAIQTEKIDYLYTITIYLKNQEKIKLKVTDDEFDEVINRLKNKQIKSN